MRRLHAPRHDGELLADPPFDSISALVDHNRHRLKGNPRLAELRSLIRTESPVSAEDAILVGGHQPELSHPGVWVKNFALNGLARRLGGTALHLVVDSDTPKAAGLKLPTFVAGDPESVSLDSLPFDLLRGTPTFEDWTIREERTFAEFLPKLRERVAGWPYEPLAIEAWPRVRIDRPLGEQFTELRRHYEREWGCVNAEWNVSAMSRTRAFRLFAEDIAADLPRFRESYNGAIREWRRANRVRSATHPAPELDEFEMPFWEQSPGGRRKLVLRPGESLPPEIRPRALTLTLFARLVLGDFFLHGIGGGKYDEATDGIIRTHYGIEPPAYQVVSATLHLPLPGFAAGDEELTAARRHVRELNWNPQRHVVPPSSEDRFVMRLVADRETLAASEPAIADRSARREWYRKLTDLNEQLRHHVWKQVPPAKARLARVEAEIRSNAILRRRDYAWPLFPAAILRPFLQRLL